MRFFRTEEMRMPIADADASVASRWILIDFLDRSSSIIGDRRSEATNLTQPTNNQQQQQIESSKDGEEAQIKELTSTSTPTSRLATASRGGL
jgi:hypothetical protein